MINFISSTYTIKNSLFELASNDALNIDFSTGEITNSAFENCKRAIKTTMSATNLTAVNMGAAIDKAVFIDDSSTLVLNGKTVEPTKK